MPTPSPPASTTSVVRPSGDQRAPRAATRARETPVASSGSSPAGGLLRGQPQRRGDREARAPDPQQEQRGREEGVDDARHPGALGSTPRASGCPRTMFWISSLNEPNSSPAGADADDPAEHRAALQPPGQPDQPARAGPPRRGRAGAGHDAGADVAPAREQHRARRAAPRQRPGTAPAATTGCRRRPAPAGTSPSARATTRRSRRRRRARAARRPRRARPARARPRRGRALISWAAQRPPRRTRSPSAATAAPYSTAPGPACRSTSERPRDARTRPPPRRRGDQHRGRDHGVRPTHGGPSSSVRPAPPPRAGVPDDDEDRHQRDAEQRGQAGLVDRGSRRSSRSATGGPAIAMEAGGCPCWRRTTRSRPGCRRCVATAAADDVGDADQREHPHRQPDPVAPQHQPDQRADAANALIAHRTAPPRAPARRTGAGTAPPGSAGG